MILVSSSTHCGRSPSAPPVGIVLAQYGVLSSFQAPPQLKNQKISILTHRDLNFYVPRRGLEPPRIAPPVPKTGVSTNFTTSAGGCPNILHEIKILSTNKKKSFLLLRVREECNQLNTGSIHRVIFQKQGAVPRTLTLLLIVV